MIGRLPDLRPEAVGGEDGPADVVGADAEDLAALDHGDRAVLHPDALVQARLGWGTKSK